MPTVIMNGEANTPDRSRINDNGQQTEGLKMKTLG